MKEEIEKINNLLLEKKAQVTQNNALLAAHNYASFRALAINQELEEQWKALE
jgi:hypothetical protein